MSTHYFSRIQLDVRHPDAKAALERSLKANPYQDHQWFWREFFPAAAGTARDYLFRRMESAESSEPPVFYTVSSRPPVKPASAWQVESRDYQPVPAVGSTFAFELYANPLVSEWGDRPAATEGQKVKTGKVTHHDIVMHRKKQLLSAQRLAHWHEWTADGRPALYELVREVGEQWLSRQGERHGFRLIATDALRVDGYRRHRLGASRGAEKPIVFSTLDFSGLLEVTDTERFQRALLGGIGHSKAFGCGLLLVRRA